MKKSFLILILVTIPFLVLGQRETLRVEKETPFMFVSQEFKGSVEQVDQFMKQFMKNFFDQKLIPTGQPMALFHNQPKDAADKEVKMEIGFPVGNREVVNVAPPLKIQEINLPAVMKHVHTGPYTQLFGTYERMRGMAKNGGLEWGSGFTIHRFLNNPENVKPGEIQTEVIIPARGMPKLMDEKSPRLKVGGSINYMVVCKAYKGSVGQIGEFVQDFMKEFFALKLSPVGQPIILFSTVPMNANDKELKMEIGFPVKEKVDVKPPLMMKQVKMGNVARQENIGPYEKLFETHKEMLQSIKRQSFETRQSQAILILLNNPSLVKPEDVKSEIIIPAEK